MVIALHQAKSSPKKPAIQSGFTLLEIVLVLFLIGLVSSTVFLFTDNIDQQAKYDETKRRMEIIRQAIVGDPNRRLNGHTEISGFAADMGRLPECIAELLELGPEVVSTPPKEYSSPCGGSAANIKQWSVDTNSGIGSGWRGPYIRVSPESNGDYRFRDGYGNSDASDAINSGWSSFFTTSSGAIQISSYGLDTTDTTDDITDANLIVSNDWELSNVVTPLLTISNSSSTAKPSGNAQILLRMYNKKFDSFFDNDADEFIASGAIGAPGDITPPSQVQYIFTMDSSTAISTGAQGFTIVCYDSSLDAKDYKVFDGDCNPTNPLPSSADIEPIFIAPRQTPILNWTIQ